MSHNDHSVCENFLVAFDSETTYTQNGQQGSIISKPAKLIHIARKHQEPVTTPK